MGQISSYLDYVESLLDPVAFKDFINKSRYVLSIREEVADKFGGLNLPNRKKVVPEGLCMAPWVVNWIRERWRWEEPVYHRLNYEEFIEWAHRVWEAIVINRKVKKEKPGVRESIQTEWLCYTGIPPAFLIRPDLGWKSAFLFPSRVTLAWFHVNFWVCEFDWGQAVHYVDGMPVSHWAMAMNGELVSNMTEEERKEFRREYVFAPRDFTYLFYLKDPVTGIRIFEIPRKTPFDFTSWLSVARGIVRDIIDERFPCWRNSRLYLSISPGLMGTASQQNFWGISSFAADAWLAIQCERLGYPNRLYGYEPDAGNILLKMSRERFARSLGRFFLEGPRGLECDTVNRLVAPAKRIPLLHSIKKLMFHKGKMYKGFAEPYDEGIPPPRARLTAFPAPIYKETTLEELGIWEDPAGLPKEYIELLESEAGVDFKTGRVPSYEEVPRLKWLFDPTIEWLKPSDFPPLDWSKGQVWPIDITREKMEIMVEEGYDGSGKDILHYSCLADRKLGQYGKTITLGTMPYKLPTE